VEIMMKFRKLLTIMVVSSLLSLVPSISRSQAPNLNVFGIEVGNTWTYQGAYQAGAAQIRNPDFEAGAVEWSAGSTGGTAYTFTIDADAYDGTKAAKLTVTNDGACSISNQESIPILRTGPYTLRLYAKVVGNVSYVSIAVWKATVPGVFPTTPVDYISPMAFGPGYELYELPIYLYAGDYIRIEIGFDNNSSGTSYVLFDKLELVNPQTYILEKTVVRTDPATFSGVFSDPAYVVEERSHGITYGGWYQVLAGELKLWGIQDGGSTDPWKFSAGLTVAWFPVGVGDTKYSTATTSVGGYDLNVSMTVNIEGKELVNLGFDTLEAYKVGYQLRTWNAGIGYDETDSWYYWMVPHLEIVKYQDSETTEVLASFAIGAGTISQETDADHDSLKDYREILYGTDRQDADTDDDGMADGWEVQYSLNPLVKDASGDKDGDGYPNIQEYRAGTSPADPTSKPRRAMSWLPLLLAE